MANPDHLRRLDEGPAAWNRWRIDEPWVRCDLDRADVSGRNLDLFDLRGIRIVGAKLDGTSLRESNLSNTRFESSSLVSTDFRGSYMEGTGLRACTAVHSDFRYSDMHGCHFHAV